MKRTVLVVCAIVWLVFSTTNATIVTETIDLDAPDITSPAQNLNGLSAQAIFTFDTDNPTELLITLSNTSTGVPTGFSNADQLLTGVSFDFGLPGVDNSVTILGGSAEVGAGGVSINFNNVITQLVAGDDLSGEWGYSDMDYLGLLPNFVSGNTSQNTSFGGANLDGPVDLNGPQAGIATATPQVAMAGLGAIADSIVIKLNLDTALSNLDFLENGTVAEFGSDAAFVTPEPTTLATLAFGSLALFRKRKRQ